MFSLQKIFIILILLFQNNIFLINASTTDFEMDRVCSASNFAKYKHKTGYRTAQHFADDEGMYTSSAHPFYRSLFMTREKNNMSLFISSMVSLTAAALVKGPKYLDLSFFISREKSIRG